MSSPTAGTRSSGVLLHVTSLPGPFGVGDLGPGAHRWVDTLATARQRWWQVLPVGPTGYGDSPYQALSTFAGNPVFISPEALLAGGLASANDLTDCECPTGPADYPKATATKRRLVAAAAARARAGDARQIRADFEQFCAREAHWLADFSLFVALKQHHAGAPWWEWPRPLALRDPNALKKAAAELAREVEAERFGQFLFFRQWDELRGHAARRGVRMLGDLPIYVAEDSADVWANPELFKLDVERRPTAVAGVPPDYFSATGQLWGNPVYNWEAHRETDFRWWIARMRAAMRLFDVVRIDHFRGLEAYWSVPAGHPTAEHGQWLLAPGAELLAALRTALGGLPVVAEDLGVITPVVDALREEFGLPGMRVLQFAFGGAVEARFLPHHYTRNLLVTTGTHDNDTTQGWYDAATPEERASLEAYAPDAADEPVWALIRLAWASVADFAITPLQDLLSLGSDARLNTPGTASGNWGWRATEAQAYASTWVDRLAGLSRVYERESISPETTAGRTATMTSPLAGEVAERSEAGGG